MYKGEESDRLTFVIPSFNITSNDGAYLRAMVGFQSFSELEDVDVIVSDYGSTDKTKEIIESYGFTYLYTPPNKDEHFNFCKCANNGIAEAKTKYICVLGFDWIVHKELPKVAVEVFNNSIDDNIFVQIESTELLPKKKGRLIWQQVIFKRKHAILSYGFDERFNTWGTEDKDFKERLITVNKLKKKQLPKRLHFTHLSHEYFWRKNLYEWGNDRKWEKNKVELHKEIVNSYWSPKPKISMYDTK